MAYSNLISLPFRVRHTLYGVHGLLRLEPGYLIIECQVVENVLGLIRGPMRQLEIPLLELADVSLHKNRTGGRVLSLQTLYLPTLRNFPGAHEGHCQLLIRRQHAALADEFSSRLELEFSEAHLRRLEGAEPRYLPPSAETRLEQLLKLWDGLKGLIK